MKHRKQHAEGFSLVTGGMLHQVLTLMSSNSPLCIISFAMLGQYPSSMPLIQQSNHCFGASELLYYERIIHAACALSHEYITSMYVQPPILYQELEMRVIAPLLLIQVLTSGVGGNYANSIIKKLLFVNAKNTGNSPVLLKLL